MSIEVNGHKLPPLLVKLIDEGKWGNRQVLPTEALNKILVKAGFNSRGLTMTMNTFDRKKLDAIAKTVSLPSNPDELEELINMLSLYHEASSKLLDHEIEDEGIIDIDKSVHIAFNYDEDVICLDYRVNLDNPRVMVSLGIHKWRMIAPDFESFARELGLVE